MILAHEGQVIGIDHKDHGIKCIFTSYSPLI